MGEQLVGSVLLVLRVDITQEMVRWKVAAPVYDWLANNVDIVHAPMVSHNNS